MDRRTGRQMPDQYVVVLITQTRILGWDAIQQVLVFKGFCVSYLFFTLKEIEDWKIFTVKIMNEKYYDYQ